MTIHLPEHLERFVHDQVKAGRYSTEDEVINDALERLRQHTQPVRNSKGLIGALRDDANKLDEAVEHAMSVRENQSSHELQQRLLKAGIISEIKPPITDLTPYQNRQAILVQGEPLSEAVIRERR
jgi:putative addiction module CopG family antidote